MSHRARGLRTAAAEEAKIFRYRFADDDRFIYRMTIEAKQTQAFGDTKLEATIENVDVSIRTLERIDEDGNGVIRSVNKLFQAHALAGPHGELKYDSRSPTNEGMMTPVFDRLKGASVRITVSPEGRVREVNGLTDRLRVRGYAAIDQGRNQMATDALVQGFEETMWIDADVGFEPNDIERLRSHGEPIVCGIYPQKGKRALACHVLPGTKQLVFGQGGGLHEILYAGTGFLLVRRQVYMDLQRRLDLPVCNERFGRPMIPYFQPLVRQSDDGWWYLAVDYSFCERARQCGYRVLADTTVRLWHVGQYSYSWEDAGLERQRFGTFTYHLT